MSYVPKYILKRMFPKDKSLKVVKKDGKKFISLEMINVISPIAVPDKIEIGDFNVEDIGDYISIKINGKDLKVTYDRVKNYVELWTDGKGYTLEGIFINNEAAGITIPVGGKLTLLIAYVEEVPDLVPGPGEYEITVDVKVDNPMNITVKLNLNDFDVDFDPSST